MSISARLVTAGQSPRLPAQIRREASEKGAGFGFSGPRALASAVAARLTRAFSALDHSALDHAHVARIVRYAAAGGGSLVLQLVLQALLISALSFPVRVGIVASYELALVAHFFANDSWVFAERRLSWRRFVAFHATALTAEGVTLGCAFAFLASPLATLLGAALAPSAATIVGTGAAVSVTFCSSFFWIWRPRTT